MSEPSQYADTLKALDEMQGSLTYAARRQVLRDAERIISKLEQERDAAVKDAERYRWQPMSTAPRDGTEVLLQIENRAGIPGKMLVGHHMPGGHCIEDHPAIDRGWFFWNGCMFDRAAKPLAWMPLPAIDAALAAERTSDV